MPNTRERVPAHTTETINRDIQQKIEKRIEFFQRNKSQIAGRLNELDREWDIERAIEANASALAFTGIVLCVAHDRRWLVLPAVVTTFLFQHAIQGWCPPVPILRSMGFRTSHEIEEERQALKAIRGDFNGFSQNKVNPKAVRKAAHA
jgi:hypothetical protein